ncbi:hypothetical protein JL722_4656 [Aureococcus anophagefferens]|nr:hypothetical protein JL722_4656 [Aureococcus anophagefferens]
MAAALALKEYRRCSPAKEILAALGSTDASTMAAFSQLVRGDDILARCPPRADYQRRVFGALVAAAERAGEAELDDGVFELLASRRRRRRRPRHVTVDVAPGRCVSLRTFDRSNEVGLRLWPAALLFAEWALADPRRFAGRSVLELGAGVGLCGLALAATGAARVVLTDGDGRVVTNLRHNADLNGRGRRRVAPPKLVDEAAAFYASGAFDAVVAADCVYDAAVAPALAGPSPGRWTRTRPRRLPRDAVRNDATWAATLAALAARASTRRRASTAMSRAVAAAGGPTAVSPAAWAGLAATSRGDLRMVRVTRRV